MEWIELDQGELTEHGSSGLYLIEAARLQADAHFRVHVVKVSPGGILGHHAGRWWQLFCVAAGEGWVSAEDGQRQPIESGQAVLWAPGEVHESGSDTGMVAVTVQSSVRITPGS